MAPKIKQSHGDLLLLAAAFILSRAFYLAVAGVHFDGKPLEYFIQYLDPELLRHDLLRSVYYLHCQPPAFNLFLGAILKLFPAGYDAAFQIIYLGVGFLFSLVLLKLLLAMRVHRGIALTLAIAHAILPTTVLYENWLFYSYPVAALLGASAYFLLCFLGTFKFRHGVLFFLTLCLISCIHAMFGAAWLILTAAALVGLCKSKRKTVILSAAPAIAITLLLAIKQYLLFGSFTLGASLLGPNLAVRMAYDDIVPPAQRQSLIASGEVPPYFFEKPPLISKVQDQLPPSEPTHVAALDEPLKSNGEINLNHIGYIAMGRIYQSAALRLIWDHPGYYLRSFEPTICYFYPAGDPMVITEIDTGWLAGMVRAQDILLCGQMIPRGLPYILLIALPALLIFGVARTWRGRKSWPSDPRAIVTAFMLGSILYSSLATVCISWGDWNRYRFGVDAFFLVLLGMAMTDAWHAWKPAAATPKPCNIS